MPAYCLGVLFLSVIVGCSSSAPVTVEEPKVVSVRPEWIDKIPEKNGFIYAVGSHAKSYFVDAREKAGERARAELALSIQSHMSVLIVDYFTSNGYSGGRQDLFASVSRNVSQLTLEGAQVLEYWEDPNDGTTWTLVRMPVGPNAKNIASLAAGMAEQGVKIDKTPDKAAQEIQAQAEKALNELETAIADKDR